MHALSVQHQRAMMKNLKRPLQTWEPSRTLALKLEETANVRNSRVSLAAVAESFLKFSPRVQFREVTVAQSARSLWIFIDIASTTHFFQSSEEGLSLEAVN